MKKAGGHVRRPNSKGKVIIAPPNRKSRSPKKKTTPAKKTRVKGRDESSPVPLWEKPTGAVSLLEAAYLFCGEIPGPRDPAPGTIPLHVEKKYNEFFNAIFARDENKKWVLPVFRLPFAVEIRGIKRALVHCSTDQDAFVRHWRKYYLGPREPYTLEDFYKTRSPEDRKMLEDHLPLDPGHGPLIWPPEPKDIEVSMDDLRAYAERIGERPALIFPRGLKNSHSQFDSLLEQVREKTVALARGMKSPQWKKILTHPDVVSVIDGLGIRRTEKTMKDWLRPALKKAGIKLSPGRPKQSLK